MRVMRREAFAFRRPLMQFIRSSGGFIGCQQLVGRHAAKLLRFLWVDLAVIATCKFAWSMRRRAPSSSRGIECVLSRVDLRDGDSYPKISALILVLHVKDFSFALHGSRSLSGGRRSQD